MKIVRLFEHRSGGQLKQRYEIMDDNGITVFCGSDPIELSDQDLLDRHDQSQQPAPMPVFVEITDFEQDLLITKNDVKTSAVVAIKTQLSPTIESVVAAIPGEPHMVEGIILAYQRASAAKGYISADTWDLFVEDIKTTSIEELLARR